MKTTQIFPFLLLIFTLCAYPVSAAPTISNLSDNRGQYSGGMIPKYEKLEITFSINGTSATNTFFPYDASPPSGIIPETGITVNAIFTSPNGTEYIQPAFYYQEFQDEVKTNREWYYPTGNFSWKVRFSPNGTGIWQYKISVQDAGGSTQSATQSFNVADSQNNGFVKVSKKDARYFEYDSGKYFPSLGFNLNGGQFSLENPILDQAEEFESMSQNGINLSRVWITQHSIYSSSWGVWMSPNPAHIKNEAIMGISHPADAAISAYPNSNPPPAFPGSEFYMWLNFDETRANDGIRYKFTPCRLIGWTNAGVPLKQNTNYRVRVRYNAQGLIGPRVTGSPYGFVVKEARWLWSETVDTKSCYYPGTGTVLAATYKKSENDPWADYPDPQDPNWRILEGSFNSGTKDFLSDYLYLAIENARDPNGNNQDTGGATSGGHVFIDHIWLEENKGNDQYGPNLIYKPWMAHHYYINQRNAYALDKLLDFAKQKNVYLKTVMLEKNDLIFSFINYEGTLATAKIGDNFYGNGRETGGKTKVRWLHEAWWRYMQARWGYSPNIHSWELLNEGPPGPADGLHWIMADEFGKYMQCRVFGVQPATNAAGKLDCQYNHPNSHMVTTSFFGSFPYNFWRNTSGNYPDIDYADLHLYAKESDNNPSFYDAALFSQESSVLRGAFKLPDGTYNSSSAAKPVLRGEVAWQFDVSKDDLLAKNADNGTWLHNFIWAGINHGGLVEHFFAGGNFTRQIWSVGSGGAILHDHRPMFKTYYNFIKDIPLNNGNYEDAAATFSNSSIRAWGQKDTNNQRAHLWIQNKNHTWKNVVGGVNITPQSATITFSGFKASKSYQVEWWDTYTGAPASTQNITTDSQGNLVLSVNNLTTDTALRIGDYPSTTSSARLYIPIIGWKVED